MRRLRYRPLKRAPLRGICDDLDDGRAHGRDERIGVAAFDDELEFTYRLMKELSAR